MKVMVTGYKGYIGRHVVEALWKSGHGVVGLDIGARVLGTMDLQEDVTGFWSRTGVMSSLKGVDVVVHCAGSCSVEKSLDFPVEDFRVNGLGTLNMMETSHLCGVKRFVNLSSGGACSVEARSPYGISKQVGEMYGEYYSRNGMPVVSLRLGNVYGGEGHHGVIAEWVNRVGRGMPLLVNGDGSQRRDFVWYEDVVKEIVGQVSGKFIGVTPVGSGESVSLKELKGMFDEVVGKELPVVYGHRDEREVDDVRLDGLEEAVKVRDGIERLLNGNRAG